MRKLNLNSGPATYCNGTMERKISLESDNWDLNLASESYNLVV